MSQGESFGRGWNSIPLGGGLDPGRRRAGSPALILPSLMARRAAKCFSTSIFLMRLIAAPAVLLISSAAFFGSAEDIRFELLQASSRCIDRASNCVARHDQFHSPVFLPAAELSFEATGKLLPKPVALTEFADYALLHKVIANRSRAIL